MKIVKKDSGTISDTSHPKTEDTARRVADAMTATTMRTMPFVHSSVDETPFQAWDVLRQARGVAMLVRDAESVSGSSVGKDAGTLWSPEDTLQSLLRVDF